MARLYANENFPFLVVQELRRLGHDALTISESGRANRALPDSEVVAFATSQARAVLTLNRKHFIAIHRENPKHAGMIVCTVDADFAGQARRIHDSIAGRDDLSGQLIRVNRPDR